VIYFLIIVFVAGLLIYGVMMVGAVNTAGKSRSNKNKSNNLDRALVKKRWQAIQSMQSGGGNNLRQAVLEADKLLDYCFKNMGYPGENMADRLKSAQSQLSDKNSVWDAHKLRNVLAHEIDYDLVVSQAKAAILSFEQALKDLGVLK
jgi:hypothetical protein